MLMHQHSDEMADHQWYIDRIVMPFAPSEIFLIADIQFNLKISTSIHWKVQPNWLFYSNDPNLLLRCGIIVKKPCLTAMMDLWWRTQIAKEQKQVISETGNRFLI